MSVFSKIGQKDSKDKPNSKGTTIDGKKVPNIIKWGEDLLEEASWTRENQYNLVSGGTYSDIMKNRLLQFMGENWDLREDIESDDQHSTWNFLFSIIEIQLAIMLSNRPEISFKPEGVEDVALADILDRVLKKEQDKAMPSYDEFQATRAQVAKVFGFSIGYVGYTYLKNPPIGMHDFRVCDPLGVFWQYGKGNVYSSRYFIEVRIRDVSDVEDEFQVSLPEGYNESIEADRRTYCIWDYARGFSSGKSRESLIPQCTTIDIWYKDSSKNVEKRPVWMTDEETGEDVLDEFGQKIQARNGEDELLEDRITSLKYPGMRRIVFAGDHLLYDGPNPYEHKILPFTGTKNYRVPFTFPGLSEFHQLEDIQYTIDDTITQIKINNQLTGNNQKIVDYGKLEEDQVLTNEPAQILRALPGTGVEDTVKTIEQSPINPQAVNLYNMAREAGEVISGVTQWARGAAFASDSGKKVRYLDALSARRVAGPMWNIEHSIKLEGLILLKNIRQFLPDEKVWRISGVDPEKMMEMREAGGSFNESRNGDMIISLRDLPVDLEYDIEVSPSGEIPTSREGKLELLVQLKQAAPTIPDWILFKYIDIPELAELSKKMEEEWNIMQEKMKMVEERLAEEGGGNLPSPAQRRPEQGV